ncbi:hypothetical protein G5B39_16880 (plasmid) [Rhodobacteraceae bacterium SC52]|nr:hypothetical protein G5B39_16880 [Rhodobacteraceae bacterium SC52]
MPAFKANHSVRIGSDRNFGLVFCVVFVLIAVFPVLNADTPRLWAFAVAGVFLLFALWKPGFLSGLNRAWFWLGTMIGAVMAPIVMFVIFVTVMVPIGLALRLVGKDLLSQKIDKAASSYWIERTEAPRSMTNQF